MRYFLLFDSGCSSCAELVRAIEQETDGKLTARSLRESEIHETLDRLRPNWRWEPMLLEADNEKPRIISGYRMML